MPSQPRRPEAHTAPRPAKQDGVHEPLWRSQGSMRRARSPARARPRSPRAPPAPPAPQPSRVHRLLGHPAAFLWVAPLLHAALLALASRALWAYAAVVALPAVVHALVAGPTVWVSNTVEVALSRWYAKIGRTFASFTEVRSHLCKF